MIRQPLSLLNLGRNSNSSKKDFENMPKPDKGVDEAPALWEAKELEPREVI